MKDQKVDQQEINENLYKEFKRRLNFTVISQVEQELVLNILKEVLKCKKKK